MTEIFTPAGSEDAAGRYQAELENALLAAALIHAGDAGERRQLYARWLNGTFNATAYGLEGLDRGYLQWSPEGSGHRLTWFAPTGLACPLARVYEQPDGTWAAMVVAGVKDELMDAMMSAEWAIARLTA